MSNVMWAGRFSKSLSQITNEFNSSIKIDKVMFAEDIKGSIAHATMLGATGVIDKAEADKIVEGLTGILEDLTNGNLVIDENSEDIHMFIEAVLTNRLGETGKRLHTSRSRNDQVALDSRLYTLNQIKQIKSKLLSLINAIYKIASENTETIMPGYTHLQRAQPVTFAHHLLAYSAMFMRDYDRLSDAYNRTAISPLGSCALAGTTYPIDRQLVQELLGLNGVSFNSMDGVSDRDFMVETASAIALIMTHLSRFSEEIILWCSWEYKFIELDDAYSTGSSIMPQKKNPDIAELVRGKTGRVYGNLVALLTMLKGLPLAYNKDMQEDKENLFDSFETVKDCLTIFAEMLLTLTVISENMLNAAKKGFINATDCADYLVKKGLPFRTAYKITGEIVAYCIKNGKVLENMTVSEYKKFNELFSDDVYQAIDLVNCVNKRTSFGGPSKESVNSQLKIVFDFIKEKESE